jgi:hypothetical protein
VVASRRSTKARSWARQPRSRGALVVRDRHGREVHVAAGEVLDRRPVPGVRVGALALDARDQVRAVERGGKVVGARERLAAPGAGAGAHDALVLGHVAEHRPQARGLVRQLAARASRAPLTARPARRLRSFSNHARVWCCTITAAPTVRPARPRTRSTAKRAARDMPPSQA